MFFIQGLEGPESAASETRVVARLTFEGNPSGSLSLSVTGAAARSIAADFLGEDEPELSEQQIGEVICELANMICGSVLSRVESNTIFRLGAPRLLEESETESVSPGATDSTIHAVEISNGALVVMVNTETPAWSTVEKSAY